MIYLDYNATTPVDKRVLNTYNKVCLEYPGNSNSLHNLGVSAKELEDYATSEISKILNLENKEIIYTSGASESNNQALKGICFKYKNRGKHIISTYLEHSSIINTLDFLVTQGFTVDYVKLDDNGQVDLDHLKSLITNDTIIVSICAIDSELGIIQPIDKISNILKEYPKCFFHVDCTQALGKIDINFNDIDIFSVSMHKIYGLKGIGMLIKNKNMVIEPLIHGGKSTTKYRAGTPPLPLIVSSMKALSLIIPNVNDNYEYVTKLSMDIKKFFSNYKNIHINSTKVSSPYVINISIPNIKPETFVHAMDEYNVYLSTKSACSDTKTMSDSVYAVTKNRNYAMTSIRISLSHLTTEEEIEEFKIIFSKVYERLEF